MARRTKASSLQVALALGLFAAGLPGQRLRDVSTSPVSKDVEAFRKLFGEACKEARRATARVYVGTRQRAFGVVVDPAGFVLSKASELPDTGEVSCILADGERVAARRGPVDEEADLILLDLRGSLGREAKISALRFEAAELEIGDLLACCGPDPLPFATGVLSLRAYTRKTRTRSSARLDLPFARTRREARLGDVPEGSAAEKAGLQAGDVIEAVDGRAVHSPRSFARAIRRKRPGKSVRIEVRRGDDARFVSMQVQRSKDRAGPRDPQQAYWGALSRVRIGFPQILQHDAVVAPRECASPLVDLQGRVVGLNIARVGRVETHALPSAVVAERLTKLFARMPR